MKRKIIAGVLALTLLTFVFTGCNDSSSSNSSTGSSANSASLEKTDFNLGYMTNATSHLFAYIAYEEGYFAEEGLNVTLTEFAGASDLLTALEAEKLDVALIGSVPTLTFQSQGHDISIFGGAMTNGHGYVIKDDTLDDSAELDISVLKGKTVASVHNSIQDVELLTLLDKAGLEIGEGEDKVNVVYFDSQKDAYAALQGNEIDASSVYAPYTSLAKNSGYKVIYYCNEVEEFENQPCCRQVALTDALSQYPNTYNAFERAFIKAYKFFQENKEQTLVDVKKYVDIDEEDLEFEIYGGHASVSPDPDKQATLSLKESIVELGYTEDFDAEEKFNTDIYKKAIESLVEENPKDEVYSELLDHFNTYE